MTCLLTNTQFVSVVKFSKFRKTQLYMLTLLRKILSFLYIGHPSIKFALICKMVVLHCAGFIITAC